jgi:hypothetical protein
MMMASSASSTPYQAWPVWGVAGRRMPSGILRADHIEDDAVPAGQRVIQSSWVASGLEQRG